jgi:hypothetical protein
VAKTQIRITSAQPPRYVVEVEEGASRTRHEVMAQEDDVRRYAGSASVSAERLLEASFQFLLEREPKESILRQFDLPVIEKYFPEYPREIRKRLA